MDTRLSNSFNYLTIKTIRKNFYSQLDIHWSDPSIVNNKQHRMNGYMAVNLRKSDILVKSYHKADIPLTYKNHISFKFYNNKNQINVSKID